MVMILWMSRHVQVASKFFFGAFSVHLDTERREERFRFQLSPPKVIGLAWQVLFAFGADILDEKSCAGCKKGSHWHALGATVQIPTVSTPKQGIFIESNNPKNGK